MPSNRSTAIAEQLSCVRVADLGCFDPNRCWQLGHCVFSRGESRRDALEKPPPKRAARIKDPGAIKRKMRGERKCRCGCGQLATDGHHILPRSLGGDDVPQNICGLFHDCHMQLEFDAEDGKTVRELVGENLRDDEIDYVLRKLRERSFATTEGSAARLGDSVDDPGWDFLKRYYGVERRVIERSDT